jgi:hypothetical protein
VISNEEGQDLGSVDQDVKVVDQRFSVEEVVRRNQEVPEQKKYASHLFYENVRSQP